MQQGKKSFLTHEISEAVSASIIGSGEIVTELRKLLEEKGCQVAVYSHCSKEAFQGAYVFAFTDFVSVPSSITPMSGGDRHVLLVVSANNEQKFAHAADQARMLAKRFPFVRVLLAGSILSWDVRKLSETSIWALFTRTIGSQVIDLVKSDSFSEKQVGISKMRRRRLPRIRVSPPRFRWRYFLVLIVLLPVLILLYNFYSIFRSHQAFYRSAVGNDWIGANESFVKATEVVGWNSLALDSVSRMLNSFGFHLATWEKIRDINGHVLSIENTVLSLHSAGLSQESFLGHSTALTKGMVSQTDKYAGSILKDMEGIEESLSSITLPFLPVVRIQELLDEKRKLLGFAQSLLPVVGGMIDENGVRTYLLLFQNNLELRPTGGFIGSYALVTLDHGKLLPFIVHDVYEADGQLKAHVDPPLPIRNVLGQPNWFLRDSNFDPDFSISAQRAMWFLEKETGQRVDGVIGVNLNVLKLFLSSLGGVYLPDYKESITAENLFLKTTVYTQKGFFPGSSAKRDFLHSLADGILFGISAGGLENYSKLGNVLEKSLDEKDILIFSTDQPTQRYIEEKGWAGRMIDISCTQNPCISDYVSIVDANFGINKTNLYITKGIRVTKSFNESSLISRIAVDYVNTSPEDTFPSGIYKDYVRVYVPKGISLSFVRINGAEVQSQVATYGMDKEEIGFAFDLLPLAKKSIEIEYVQPLSLDSKKTFYQLLFQKQAGDYIGSLHLSFDRPQDWKMHGENFQLQNNGLMSDFGTDTLVDRIFLIKLTQ